MPSRKVASCPPTKYKVQAKDFSPSTERVSSSLCALFGPLRIDPPPSKDWMMSRVSYGGKKTRQTQPHLARNFKVKLCCYVLHHVCETVSHGKETLCRVWKVKSNPHFSRKFLAISYAGHALMAFSRGQNKDIFY